MKMCFHAMLAVVLVTQILLVFAGGGSLPLWKTQLTHFPEWEGYYEYQNTSDKCQMVVKSVQEDDNGGALVSFTANKTTFDMTAFSEDDISIVFKTEPGYHPGDLFYDDFQFVVELIQMGSMHMFLGNITHPPSNHSTIRLRPEGTWVTNHGKSSDLAIGLAVGISVTLFIICVVIGIAILRWAIKKGYLRHVAMSYKNFRNPDSAGEPPVSFSNTQQESQPEEVNVHI